MENYVIRPEVFQPLEAYLSANWTLQQIQHEFALADIAQAAEHDFFPPPGLGQRKTLVRRYLQTLDFTDPINTAKILRVVERIVSDMLSERGTDETSPRYEHITEQLELVSRWLEKTDFVIHPNGRITKRGEDRINTALLGKPIAIKQPPLVPAPSLGPGPMQGYHEFAMNSKAEPAPAPSPPTSHPNGGHMRDAVFIVHGHNGELKQFAARTVEKLKLRAIILHEQANAGATIIEKFERYSDVKFAVIVATADDEGRAIPQDATDRNSTKGLQPRARQNVILELGFFAAKLGRKHVFVLTEEGVELPSDLAGVIYEKADPAGNWRFALVREMQAAGLNVDSNDILHG